MQSAWVWTPGDAGLVYATLRLDFPDNLEPLASPELDPRVVEFTRTDYPDGTEEWHLVLAGCPQGGVRVFRQPVRLLDGDRSNVHLSGGDSWIRDCAFELHRVEVVNDLTLNEPDCGVVDLAPSGWSALKVRYD